MLPLVASGLAADEIGPLEATVRAAAEAHFGPRILAAPTMSERLERGGAKGLRCDRTDPACSAQLGAVCGVGRVLVASLSAAPGRSTLALRIIDAAEAVQLAHAAGRVSDVIGADEVSAVLRALDEPAASQTSVHVRGPAGSLLVVDGVDHGALPMAAPLVDLAPGPHELGLDGPSTFRVKVELRRGEPVELQAPTPRAPAARPAAAAPAPAVASGPSPLLVTAVGGGGAALVGAATLVAGLTPLVGAELAAGRLAEREARAQQDPTVLESEAAAIREDHEAAVSSQDAWQRWGGLATLVGGALLVTGVAVGAVGLAMGLE